MRIELPFGVTWLIYAEVYGWRMSGLLGRDGVWFLGFSSRP